MADQDETLFAPTVAEIHRLRDELRAAVAARWQLARFELGVAVGDVRRLVVALAVAGLLALVSLPVLVVAAATALDGTWGLDRTAWLLIWFAGLVVAAVVVGGLGWLRFRRHFVGLEETLEVLREDQAWLESLSGQK
ncbi:MAG TPA: phage holin family protein [Pirellulales bacterium]|nr:phage holin family protein [Pirellulales bacterium]